MSEEEATSACSKLPLNGYCHPGKGNQCFCTKFFDRRNCKLDSRADPIMRFFFVHQNLQPQMHRVSGQYHAVLREQNLKLKSPHKVLHG